VQHARGGCVFIISVELATRWSLDLNTRPTTTLECSALPKAIENYYMADVANLIKLVDTRGRRWYAATSAMGLRL
jgi:hypothetical protein